MPVIKIGISKELDKLHREFNNMMDELFRVHYGPISCSTGWRPAIDIYEDPGAIYVVADLAGVEADSLELILQGQFLRMSGNRKPPIDMEQKRFFQMEVEYGPFERIIKIPLAVESENITARLENGLLLIRFIKKGQNNMTIKIE